MIDGDSRDAEGDAAVLDMETVAPWRGRRADGALVTVEDSILVTCHCTLRVEMSVGVASLKIDQVHRTEVGEVTDRSLNRAD